MKPLWKFHPYYNLLLKFCQRFNTGKKIFFYNFFLYPKNMSKGAENPPLPFTFSLNYLVPKIRSPASPSPGKI